MKCPFLFCFLTMGWRGIGTDTIEHKCFDIFGKKPPLQGKKHDAMTAVTMSQLQSLFWVEVKHKPIDCTDYADSGFFLKIAAYSGVSNKRGFP